MPGVFHCRPVKPREVDFVPRAASPASRPGLSGRRRPMDARRTRTVRTPPRRTRRSTDARAPGRDAVARYADRDPLLVREPGVVAADEDARVKWVTHTLPLGSRALAWTRMGCLPRPALPPRAPSRARNAHTAPWSRFPDGPATAQSWAGSPPTPVPRLCTNGAGRGYARPPARRGFGCGPAVGEVWQADAAFGRDALALWRAVVSSLCLRDCLRPQGTLPQPAAATGLALALRSPSPYIPSRMEER